MNYIDSCFFTIFNHYKAKHKNKANTIALVYVLLLQASLFLLFGTFLLLFLKQMHVDALSNSKAWVLFTLLVVALIFRNWIYYTGKKRKVLNAKSNKNKAQLQNIWLLWLIPFSCFILFTILTQRL